MSAPTYGPTTTGPLVVWTDRDEYGLSVLHFRFVGSNVENFSMELDLDTLWRALANLRKVDTPDEADLDDFLALTLADAEEDDE